MHIENSSDTNLPGPENHFVQVRGIKLRYADWGNNGPDVLMLHGDMRTSRSWDAVARDIHARFHVVSLDSRGHGDSDWPASGYRYEDRIEEVAELCHQIGLSSVVGVGHSTGGAVLMLVGQRYPDLFSHLIMLEPVVVMNEAFQRRVSQRREWRRRNWNSRDELREHLKGHDVAGRWRDDVIEDVVKYESMELPNGMIDMKWASETMNWQEREGDYFDLKPIFRALGIPILFIASEERADQFKDMVSLMDELPELQMATVKKSGHNMYMERPDAIAKAIETFVDGERLPEVI